MMKYCMLFLLWAGPLFAGTKWTLKVGNRNAIIYAPDNRDKPALVISMHGIGGGTWWTPGAMQYEALADTANFVVAYPAGENAAWDLGGNKDVNFILAIIDSMYNRYQIDRDRVYASGFSMGGMMSWYLSCKIPDKIAAIVPGDGYPMGGMSGCSETRHVPALQIHGTADDFVSYSGFVGNFLPSQISRYGCPSTPVKTSPYPEEVNGRNASQLAQTPKSFMEYYGPCEKNGLKSELALLSVDGMIHDWATPDKANASDDPNYKGKPFDVNGTWEAWNFMRTHSLKGNIPIVVIPQGPYNDQAAVIPGTIEAENYDVGGEGKAYHDSDVGNSENLYRTDGVDISSTESGYAVGWTVDGEWLEYSVHVETSQVYQWSARVSAGGDGSAFRIKLDDNDMTGAVSVPNTDSWDTYTEIRGTTTQLTAGDHILRLEIEGSYFNIDWIKFSDVSTALASPMQFGSPTVSQYDLYSLTGTLMGRFEQGQWNVRPGIYYAKPVDGKSSAVRVEVKTQ